MPKRILVTLAAVAAGAILLVAAVAVVDSGTDSFSGTVRSFSLDRLTYSVGDTVHLTLEICGDKEVRFFENIERTLNVWLGLRVPYMEESTSLTYRGIMSEYVVPRPPGLIATYKLHWDKPLRFDFQGFLNETPDGKAFVLEFPTFNKRFTVDKIAYANALSLEIHGKLRPVRPSRFDSLEDYIPNVKLVINAD